jgi:aminopeptidase 2
MSTYLLALANGEFVHLESSYESPLSGKVRPLRIYGVTYYFDYLSWG